MLNLQSKYFVKINQQIEFHRSMIVIQILGIPFKKSYLWNEAKI